MSNLASFGSLQASSWAVQRREAIEKAKQLKAERGNNLQKTGEMALNSTQYQQKPSISNQRDNFGSKTAKFDSIDDYSNKRNLASTANYSKQQQDVLGVRNQNVNYSDYSNNQMNKGTRQYNNTSERISSKGEIDQRNYTMNKAPQNNTQMNPNYRKQYKPDFTTDSSPSSSYQQQQNTRTTTNDNYKLKTIPQDSYSHYQAQQDDYPKNMKPNPVKRNPLQQDYLDSFADRKVQQQPQGQGQRRFEQQEYDQLERTYDPSNYTRNQDNKGYSVTSYQRPSSREVTSNNQYQNQTSVRNPQPTKVQPERTFNQDRRIAPPTNPVQNASSDEELIECPAGCGRSFFAHVLEKHAKICVKVFQTKRKEFNTAAQRQTEEQQQVPQKKPALKNQKTMQQTQLNRTAAMNKPIAAKKPDWKQQSEAFRASMKVARGEKLSKDEQVAITKNQQDSLVPCDHCGRKFNEKAAERHIPFCQSKQKMEALKKGPKAKPTKKF